MILLDDAQSTAAIPTSRVYESPVRVWQIMPSENPELDRTAINTCLHEIAQSLGQGQYVVAAFAYEVGRSIHKLPARIPTANVHPLIEAWAFSEFKPHSKEDLDQNRESFIKFLSDSRDWAFEYIENSQSVVKEVIKYLENKNNYNGTYYAVNSGSFNLNSLIKLNQSLNVDNLIIKLVKTSENYDLVFEFV